MSAGHVVSIISPCYNVEKTVGRLFQSIIDQDYPDLEIIIVDDGSTDKTKSIIDVYLDKFQAKGYRVKYIYQENMGLGAAIATGLKYVTGEFLIWPDADDFLLDHSIISRANYLLEHPNAAVVTSDALFFGENDVEHHLYKLSSKYKKSDLENLDQFDLMIKGKSIFCPGCHMLRVSVLDDVNPERYIYPWRRGQNWQMLLPVYYKHERHYIDKPLYGYVVYGNSLSRCQDTRKGRLERINEHQSTLENTIRHMKMEEKDKRFYIGMIKVRYLYKRLVDRAKTTTMAILIKKKLRGTSF